MAAPLVGKRVRLTGINGRPQLNGQEGIAESFNHDTSRYIVLTRNETIAVRPTNLVAVANNGDHDDYEDRGGIRRGVGRGGFGAAGGGGGGGGIDPKLLASGALAVLVGVLGVSLVPAVLLAGVGYAVLSGGLGGGGIGNILEPIAQRIFHATGVMLSPAQTIGSVVGFLGLLWFFLLGTGNRSYHMDSYGGGGYGGGYGGGGLDFYWIMGVVFLSSTVWRMGGGGQPNGWSFDQLWHSLSNMDIWRGMMLMNLVAQVFGGGGGRRRGRGFGF